MAFLGNGIGIGRERIRYKLVFWTTENHDQEDLAAYCSIFSDVATILNDENIVV